MSSLSAMSSMFAPQADSCILQNNSCNTGYVIPSTTSLHFTSGTTNIVTSSSSYDDPETLLSITHPVSVTKDTCLRGKHTGIPTQQREPYDWMKKRKYPKVPEKG